MVKRRQGERVKLYVRGTILRYKRSKSNQYPNTSLIQIEGVNTKEEVAWYCGKRMVYIYKAKVKKNEITVPHTSQKTGLQHQWNWSEVKRSCHAPPRANV
ncbi:60S ribosomal protein L35a-1 [Vitis vinifera]|uniref:60S ribosomal protein L35a-1 n=1 Tax=Vitis vinifera TaxID=29760 RepID=A0A438K743_VITVI|nr:60S ribosomal protein L35a-1 [Vitis vinifera]